MSEEGRGRKPGQQPPAAPGPAKKTSSQSPKPGDSRSQTTSQSPKRKGSPDTTASQYSTESSVTAFRDTSQGRKAQRVPTGGFSQLRISSTPPEEPQLPESWRKDMATRYPTLIDWVENHPFENPSSQEVLYVNDPRHTPEELKKAMKYAYSRAINFTDELVKMYHRCRWQLPGDTIMDFAHDDDRDIANVIPLATWLPNMINDSHLHMERRFKRTLAVVAKIYYEQRNTYNDWSPEAKRLYPLFGWLDDSKRGQWKDGTEPGFLNKFSVYDLKEGAIYILDRANDAIGDYMRLAEDARRSRNDKLIRMIKDEEVLVRPVEKPYLFFWRQSDREIRAIDLSGNDKDTDKPEAVKRRGLNRKWFKPSLALMAKIVHDVEADVETLRSALEADKARRGV